MVKTVENVDNSTKSECGNCGNLILGCRTGNLHKNRQDIPKFFDHQSVQILTERYLQSVLVCDIIKQYQNQCGSSSMVERQLPKLNVAGSSPVFRSKSQSCANPAQDFFILGQNNPLPWDTPQGRDGERRLIRF